MLKFRIRRFSTFTPVQLDYQDLVLDKDLTSKIEEAYGLDGLGTLTVENIPEYHQKRLRILQLSRRLALLPESDRKKLELPEADYAVGWQHGNESFNGVLELSRASFYANPQIEEALTDKGAYHANLWPENLPEFRDAFKDMGTEIIRVGSLVARQMDKYIKKHCPDYKSGSLEHILKFHKSQIGRLLHYFPQDKPKPDPWCSWHCDFTIITGLTCPLYLIQSTGEILRDAELEDSNCGLFIMNRHGKTLKAEIEGRSLCFQVGEVAQILSGGRLKPTPHAVLSSSLLPGISRNTMAVFCDPNPDYLIEVPEDHKRLYEKYAGISDVTDRWVKGMTFGEFKTESFRYYAK